MNQDDRLHKILNKDTYELHVQTLGGFSVVSKDQSISHKDWGREKAIQLFQFLITSRHRKGMHKEEILDRLWGNSYNGESDFKVALHGINKALEPNRKSRQESKYIIREGITYHISLDNISLDVAHFDDLIALANEALFVDKSFSIKAFKLAMDLYQGIYLPNRLYDDWTSAERERLQLAALNSYISLAELLLEDNPNESIQLAQKALQADPCWEEAYRIIMEAYLIKGNRPQAIKAYRLCENVLEKEFGIQPLPKTKSVLKKIRES